MGCRVRGSMQCRAPRPGKRRDRYAGDKVTDTISANMAPVPQEALPCIFLSAAAGARGGGCSAPLQAERGTSANRTQRVHGSTPRPSEEEEDVPSKQATPERKINKQAASSVAPAEGEREPRGQGWRRCWWRCRLTSGRPGVSVPLIVPHRGWDGGQAPVPLPRGDTGQRGRWRAASAPAGATGHRRPGVQLGTCLHAACLQRPASPF